MAVSCEHQPPFSPLSHGLASITPFFSLQLYVLIGILTLCTFFIALLAHLCFHLDRTSENREIRAREVDSVASSGPPYEVFLSFRGVDTRHEFTDFLYHGMVEAGILVFKDNESLHIGKKIGDELLQVMENSKIYIPIFSKNYASSHWCLRELTSMVDCTSKWNGNKEILPIFLDVEPNDVKLKTALYSQALSRHRKKFGSEVESWKKALIEVDEIKGWNWKRDEGQADFIRSIIRTVLAKLNVRFRKNVTEDLVGVDARVEAIIKMLDVESDSVQFLGIHGMGGIGKTTLVKVVFNQLSSSFHGCSFLSDVRESSQRHGLVYLQKQLLSKFLDSHSTEQIYDVDEGINMIKRVLHNKKVLIVLDDVDGKEQLESLAKKADWFGPGSRIIITTRDQGVLMIEGKAAGGIPAEKFAKVLTYEVQEMESAHALKLFSKRAFRKDFPPDHYVSLSSEVVSTLGKLPLAIEITGSFLNGKPETLRLDTLKKLKEAPPREVQRKLIITYERLDSSQKQVFLDIACFFVNKDKTYPFYMWDACGYYPHHALEVLFLMSLIKINGDNTIWMHDQVRDLGREIVRQENSKDPCKHSRVWNHEEALSILKWKEGNRKIEALSLGHHNDIILKHDEFADLRNLRFFQGDVPSLVGDFNNLLPSLRWFSCRRWPSTFEAKNFRPTNLVVLELSGDIITEEFIGLIRAARNLKVLDLCDCDNLTRIPDLSTLVSLERLIIQFCFNLVEIDPSIGELKHLNALDLCGCTSLQKLPEEIGYLQALTEIVLPVSLRELPETIGNLKSLFTIKFSHKRGFMMRQLRKLPHSIGGMVKLTMLKINKCDKIKELPDSVGKLQSLVELYLCQTRIGCLPDSIGNLKQLEVLRMSYIDEITKLPGAIWLLEKFTVLDANHCRNLTGEIPEDIGRLSCLRILDLSYTQISGLPTTMNRLLNLQELGLLESHIIQLPELPPSLTCLTWDNRAKLEGVIALPTGLSTLS